MFSNSLSHLNQKVYYCLLLIVLAASSFYFSTDKGIGLNVDSKIYIEGAVNIKKHGKYQIFNPWSGEIEKPSKWPPGTSQILSHFVNGGNWNLTNIKFVYFIVFCLNTFIFYIICLKLCTKSFYAFISALSFLIQSNISSVHYGVYSEPFYIMFTLLSLLSITVWLTKSHKSGLLILGMMLMLFSVYIRFVGIFTLIGFLIFLTTKYVIPKNKSKLKITIGLGIFLIFLGVCTSYAVQNNLEFAGRYFFFSEGWKHSLIRISNFVFLWINPYLTTALPSEVLKSIIGLFLITLLLYVLFFKYKFLGDELILLFSSLVLVFISFYIFHMLFLDPTVVVQRTFMPLLILLILLISRCHSISKSMCIPIFFKAGLMAIFILLFLSNIINSIEVNHQNYMIGLELNSVNIKKSELFKFIQKINDEDIIYSNEPSSIFLHSNKHSLLLPCKREFVTNKPNINFKKDIMKIKDGSFLVLFKSYDEIRKRWLVSRNNIQEFKNLSLLFRSEIGSVYTISSAAYPPPSSPN